MTSLLSFLNEREMSLIEERKAAAATAGVPQGAKVVPFTVNWVFRAEGHGGREMLTVSEPAVLYVVLMKKGQGVGVAQMDDCAASRTLLTSNRFVLTPDGYAAAMPHAWGEEGPRMHRLVMGMPPSRDEETGESRDVDHINRDRLDNRRSNLRIVSRRINAINRKQTPDTGVHWNEESQAYIATWTDDAGVVHRSYHSVRYHGFRSSAHAAAMKSRNAAIASLPDYVTALQLVAVPSNSSMTPATTVAALPRPPPSP